MTATKTRVTEEEFFRWPDDGYKHELVNGVVTSMPVGALHDAIVVWLGVLLHPFAKGLGYLIAGQAGFRMTNRNVRCPDLSFTRKERCPGGKLPIGFGAEAPDLCIEIISASESEADMRAKVDEYFESGAVLVWQLFTETRTARVYRSLADVRDLGPDDEIDGGELLPGFRSTVARLFEVE